MGLLDPQYVDAIKGFEGYRETPYWDYKQYTSGFGTKAASPDEKIDPATADQRLQTALDAAGKTVDSVNPNLPSGARAALVSLTYNAGPGWVNAGLGDLVRAGDLQGAQERLQQYNKAGGQVNPGLVARRAQEASWFGGGVPPAQVASASPAMPPSAAPLQIAPSTSPIFSRAAVTPQPTQQQAEAAPSYWQQMPVDQITAAQPPPLFNLTPPPRRPVDISKLRMALGNRGLFFSQRG